MKLKTFRHLWGIVESPESAFPKIKEQGYDGIEVKGIRIHHDNSLASLLREYDFELIAQIHTYGETVDEHIASFKELIRKTLPFRPLLINSQSGRDNWGTDEKNEFMGRALEFENNTGIPVAHEIHRGRITYNPWDTRDLLLTFDTMKLCCDFSHWVCVCERLLHDETDIIRLCAQRCIHLHSRVGYEQGPQVPDPRAPEYTAHLHAHEQWWTIIWQEQARKGFLQSTMTPEFGPPAYQHTLPFTNLPVADVWEICDWMKERQLRRFHNIITDKSLVS